MGKVLNEIRRYEKKEDHMENKNESFRCWNSIIRINLLFHKKRNLAIVFVKFPSMGQIDLHENYYYCIVILETVCTNHLWKE